MIHDIQSAQIPQKQDEHNIYVIMKTMCPPDYHHNGFVATHALGYMIYVSWVAKCMSLYIYIYIFALMYLFIYHWFKNGLNQEPRAWFAFWPNLNETQLWTSIGNNRNPIFLGSALFFQFPWYRGVWIRFITLIACI